MKISTMLLRENFYQILQNTLDAYFPTSNKQTLFVYPELNAIITRFPSKAVRSFLYAEYRVEGNAFRKIAVWLYLRACLLGCGLFAAKKVSLRGSFGKNTLIYPCNRKIRIFSFDRGTVDVVVKDGFPNNSIRNEIRFRTQNSASFLNPIIAYGENWYSEQIIAGAPAARAGKKRDCIARDALSLWDEYRKSSTYQTSVSSYAEVLKDRFMELCDRFAQIDIDVAKVKAAFMPRIMWLMEQAEKIEVGLSHGDLQPGNVWISGNSKDVFIIDWESFAPRYIGYDRTLLFGGIRTISGLKEYVNSHKTLDHELVLAEDILYRMDEVLQLPSQYGYPTFSDYLDILLRG